MAIGAGEKRPYVINDSLQIATVMSATGSFDHRAIDGADGARLMQAFKRLVERAAGDAGVQVTIPVASSRDGAPTMPSASVDFHGRSAVVAYELKRQQPIAHFAVDLRDAAAPADRRSRCVVDIRRRGRWLRCLPAVAGLQASCDHLEQRHRQRRSPWRDHLNILRRSVARLLVHQGQRRQPSRGDEQAAKALTGASHG